MLDHQFLYGEALWGEWGFFEDPNPPVLAGIEVDIGDIPAVLLDIGDFYVLTLKIGDVVADGGAYPQEVYNMSDYEDVQEYTRKSVVRLFATFEIDGELYDPPRVECTIYKPNGDVVTYRFGTHPTILRRDSQGKYSCFFEDDEEFGIYEYLWQGSDPDPDVPLYLKKDRAERGRFIIRE